MTPPIAQRLREAAENLDGERIAMRRMAQAHGPEAQGTLLLLAMPCLPPVLGVGLVFRDGIAVVLGLAGGALSLCVTGGLLLAAWKWGSAWILGWVRT